MLRTLTFALTHPMLSDARPSQPDQIVDLVLHGISTKSRHSQNRRTTMLIPLLRTYLAPYRGC